MDSMLKHDPNHCPDPDYDRTTSSTLQSAKHNDYPFMGRTGRLMGGPLPNLVVRAPSRRSERPLRGGRQAQPHSQKGSRPVDKWLAEPEPSFYKRYTMGGPELDIMRYYQGAFLDWVSLGPSNPFTCVILGGPLWASLSLHFPGLVSTVPCTPLISFGLLQTRA
jgi:hypothetical protein